MANNNQNNHGVAKGMGLAALAAAAAGAYYFYGSGKAAKHRKNLKAWTVKAQGDVMERLEQLQDVSKETYTKVVEDVMQNYKNLKNIKPTEIALLGKELKGHWNAISSDLRRLSSPAPKKKTAPAKRKAPNSKK